MCPELRISLTNQFFANYFTGSVPFDQQSFLRGYTYYIPVGNSNRGETRSHFMVCHIDIIRPHQYNFLSVGPARSYLNKTRPVSFFIGCSTNKNLYCCGLLAFQGTMVTFCYSLLVLLCTIHRHTKNRLNRKRTYYLRVVTGNATFISILSNEY